MWRYICFLLLGTSCLAQNIFQQYHVDAIIGGCLVKINKPCQDDDVTLTLYSTDQDAGKVFDAAFPDVGQWFDPRRPTKILVPGYNEIQRLSPFNMIRKAYQNQSTSINVIHVEWLKLSSPNHCVIAAVINVPQVGKCLAQLLFALAKVYPEFDPSQAHYIGMSLGTNVVTHTSRIIREEKGAKIRRITGLDLTTHFLTGFGSLANLDAGDAEFVDVIHTNGGMVGAVQNVGHVDFYVNGGLYQQMCQINTSTGIDQISFLECNHASSSLYFAESINSDVGFWGIKCASLYHALTGQCPGFDSQPREIMGERCPNNASGIYHVDTNSSPPYARGYQ